MSRGTWCARLVRGGFGPRMQNGHGRWCCLFRQSAALAVPADGSNAWVAYALPTARACEDHLMPAVSVQHGNGVLAKAEALAEAKTAHTIRSGRGSMAKWDKPSSCWFNQQ